MNRIYRTVWNPHTGTTVAVAETTKSRGKTASAVCASTGITLGASHWFIGVLRPLAAAVAMAGLAQAGTPSSTQLPTGGSVVAGTAGIASTATTGSASMTINQSSQRAAIDWRGFDVGSQAKVTFVQPSASSVTLNRVLSSNPSQIFGRISANGQVFLTNAAGVYFAPGSSVDVGGLVATTHSISNDAFMAGSNSFSRNGSTGTVENEGTLTATLGGYIALLAPTVRNQGVIVAKMGTVAMAAGETFNLQIEGGSKLIGLEVTASTVASLVENGLAVQAPGGLIILSAQALNRLQGGVVNNSGVLQANGLVKDGGRIMLRASKQITNTGSIQADAASGSTGKGGTVTLIADLDNTASVTEVNGNISAKGGDAGGDGGFIETSAHTVNVGDGATISTASAKGNQGQWLLDPYDFYIASSGGNITGTTLGTALNSNSVTIQTASGGTSVSGATASIGTTGTLGDIYVNDTVSWIGNNILTLNAYNNIYINSAVTASGSSGKLALMYGQSSTSGGTSSYSVNAAVSLQAGSNFTTQLGNTGNVKTYTVITSLGSAGDESLVGATNSLQGLGYSTRRSGNYVLGADIANGADTATWNANGSGGYYGFSPISSFSGTLDGLGHTITGLTINRSATSNVALFGTTTATASIRNLGLINSSRVGATYTAALVGTNLAAISNVYATGSVSGTTQSGGLVGYNNSATIANSYASVNVTGSSTYLGGLVGTNDGTITSSYATGSVSGAGSTVGGLLGYSSRGAITSSYATGNVNGTTYIGGLIGVTEATVTVTSSYATGTVQSTGGDTGGLIGNNKGTIATSYATGSVSAGGNLVGGLIGNNNGAAVTDSYATGNVTATGYVGGLIGVTYGTIKGSWASGSVSGTSTSTGYIGGLLGRLNTSGSTVGTVLSSYSTGTVRGPQRVGGLIGAVESTGVMVVGSYSTGSVNVTGGDAGGLIGNNTGTISSSYATGSVIAGGNLVGGLIGNNNGATVTESYATGSVTANGYVGGLVGQTSGTIANSYATGSVSAAGTVGGLIGSLTTTGTVTRSYATGRVTSTGGNVGGLVGSSSGTITSSYFDLITSGKTYGVGSNTAATGVTGYTSAEMKQSTNLSGLDYTNTWFIYDGYTNPLLRSFLTPLNVTYTVSGSKTYDGTTACGTISCTYTTGTLTSGKNLSGTMLLSGKNAATVTGTGLYSDQQGYLITASYSGTATIAQKALTISGTSAADKTYDGTNSAAITVGTLSGFVNSTSDNVTVTASGTFDSKNAGSRTATATYTLADGTGLASNYSLAATTGHSATIAQKALTVSGITAADKTYDGNTTATVSASGASYSGLVGGDAVAVSASGTFGDKNAATGKTVTLASSYSGADKDNYSITAQSSTTASIAQKALTVSGITAADKTYDGTTTATVSTSGASYNGLVSGDDVAVSASGTFGDKSAATGKTVTLASNYSGADKGNYAITDQRSTTASIAKAPLSIVGVSADTAYTGSAQSVSGYTVEGLVGNDTIASLGGVSASGASGTNAGRYTNAVAADTQTNYLVSTAGGTLTIRVPTNSANGSSTTVATETAQAPLTSLPAIYIASKTPRADTFNLSPIRSWSFEAKQRSLASAAKPVNIQGTGGDAVDSDSSQKSE